MNTSEFHRHIESPASSAAIDVFFDETTSTLSYLLLDRDSGECALIDSVLDYDPKSGRTATRSADRLIARVRELGARVRWLLETHVHADHLSAAGYLREHVGGEVVIGSHITDVQQVFGALFNTGAGFARDGRQFDRLLADGDVLVLGRLQLRALHTPGHTPACMSYVVDDGSGTLFAFVGDTLFTPDYGTARADFPGGDARVLYRSIRRLLELPPQTQLYLCHDYRPQGRALQFMTTVAAQRTGNLHVHDGISEDSFVAMRTARDATLEMPVLMLPSVQVNMRGGHLPEPEDNGVRYLKIPLDQL